MSDNITLHRAAEQARSALSGWANHGLWAWPESALQTCKQNTKEALVALDAALAEPEPEPVAWMYVNLEGECEQIEYGTPSIDDDSITLLYAAPPKPPATREPATREQIAEAYIKPDIDGRWRDFELGFRAAEKLHGIKKEDK